MRSTRRSQSSRSSYAAAGRAGPSVVNRAQHSTSSPAVVSKVTRPLLSSIAFFINAFWHHQRLTIFPPVTAYSSILHDAIVLQRASSNSMFHCTFYSNSFLLPAAPYSNFLRYMLINAFGSEVNLRQQACMFRHDRHHFQHLPDRALTASFADFLTTGRAASFCGALEVSLRQSNCCRVTS